MNESVVLITGGSTVIGSAAAVAFAKKDARMVAAGRRDEAGKALVKELRSFGLEAQDAERRRLRASRPSPCTRCNADQEIRSHRYDS